MHKLQLSATHQARIRLLERVKTAVVSLRDIALSEAADEEIPVFLDTENPTHRLTAFLKTFYQQLKPPSNVSRAECCTDFVEGNLHFQGFHEIEPLVAGVCRSWRGAPVLHGRYRVVGTIGRGTYAQILKVEDLLRGSRPAVIKVLAPQFAYIGALEATAMILATERTPGPLAPSASSLVPCAAPLANPRLSQPAVVPGRPEHAPACEAHRPGSGVRRPIPLRPAPACSGPPASSADPPPKPEPLGWLETLPPATPVGPPRPLPEPHTHIVECFETFAFGPHYCFALEALGPSLLAFDNARITLPQLRAIAAQLCASLAVLQRRQLVHADIKPENVLLARALLGDEMPHVKLIDFGNSVQRRLWPEIARKLAEHRDAPSLQTVYYRAPEIALCRPFDTAIDMWSLGCLLAELVLAEPLFCTTDNAELIQMHHAWARLVDCSPSEAPAAPPASPREAGRLAALEGRFEALQRKCRAFEGATDSAFSPMLHFLLGALHPSPARRLTPGQARRHPFLMAEGI